VDKLITKLNKYITNPHILEERARLSHYPSGASAVSRINGDILGKCHRSSWYDWKGYKPTNPIDARGRWTFAHGNKMEAMIAEQFKQMGMWAGSNVKFYMQDKNISGEVDIFVFGDKVVKMAAPDKPPEEIKKIIGVEIKTAYGYGFQKSVSQAPKPENLMQCGIYLDYWSKLYPDEIDEWRLIYMARDTHETVEYVAKLDRTKEATKLTVDEKPYEIFYLEDVYERYKILGEYVIKNQPPPQDFKYGYEWVESEERFERGKISKTALAQIQSGKKLDSDWHCLYCSHLDRCWPEKRNSLGNKK